MSYFYHQGLDFVARGDLARATLCFRRGADDGHPAATRMAGRALVRGWGSDGSDEDAGKALYRRAADLGDLTSLGHCFYYGIGVEVDYRRAGACYTQAAAAPDADAATLVAAAICYTSGDIGVPKDPQRGRALYQEAVDRGEPGAMFGLGLLLDDPAAALALYLRGAELGDTECMFNAAFTLKNGRGVAVNFAEAVKWYQRAVDKGDVDSMVNLAIMYQHAQGVPRDYAMAMRLNERAVAHGDATAMRNLAVMYRDGQGGVAKDYGLALALFLQSAEKVDSTVADCSLGWLYENGFGLPAPDLVIAMEYYRRAADRGDKFSADRLKRAPLATMARQERIPLPAVCPAPPSAPGVR